MIEFAALGLSLLALVLALYGILGHRRRQRESEARVEALQGQLESLRKQMMELHTGAIGMVSVCKPQKGPCRRSTTASRS